MGKLTKFACPVKGDFMRKFEESQSTVPLDLKQVITESNGTVNASGRFLTGEFHFRHTENFFGLGDVP